MSKIFSSYFWVFVIALLAGFVSGLLAYLALGSGFIVIPYVSQWYLSRQYLDRGVIITQPRKVVVEQDLQSSKVKEQANNFLLNIYVAKNNSATINNFYLPSDRLALAIALTSDGWLITKQALLKELTRLVVVGYDRKSYSIKQVINDKVTGLSFIKIDAKNLPVANLASDQDITDGQEILLVDGLGKIKLTNILQSNWQNKKDLNSLINSSDKFATEILLADENLSAQSVGLNYAGAVVGLPALETKQLIPIWQINNVLATVLKQQVISRPSLGISYFDLQDNFNVAYNFNYGALIRQINATSPALNLLQVGDIILAVNNETLKDTNLTNLVQSYKVGDDLEIRYYRDNKESTVTVKLK
ncbi:MAG: S1C family serine protease [Candidatus Buchananbacteria bacterium]